MKNRNITFAPLLFLFLFAFAISAQVPNTFIFKGNAQNEFTLPIANQQIDALVSITTGSSAGPVIYMESHIATTGEIGEYILQIGSGTPSIGLFDAINWSDGLVYFLNVFIDESGGGIFNLDYSNQLLSVPYANYAEQSGNAVIQVANIAELKNVNTVGLLAGKLAYAEGFDAPGDNCGGSFYWSPSVLSTSNTLDGIAMNSNFSGSWHRVMEGPIHTRWAGIKAAVDTLFNQDGFGTNNRLRWNNLSNYCTELMMLLEDGKVHAVRNSIYVDPGIHDFVGGTIFVGQGIGVDGAGPGKSILRFNLTSGTCIQVGDPGDRQIDKSLESAFDIIKNISIIHESLASTGTETGVAFDNTLRRCELYNVHVHGFGVNVDINAFGIDVRHCFITRGYTSNLRVGPQGNSMMIFGCRIDGQRNTSTGESILIDSDNARNILIQRCEVQRSERVAIRILGVSSLAIRDCFFEGNNRSNGSHPDIWIGGAQIRNAIVDGCYFTGTGRNNSTNSRAINLRNDLTSSARITITNNEQANSPNGSFSNFIDIDANVSLILVAFNNIHSAVNSFPPNVMVQGF